MAMISFKIHNVCNYTCDYCDPGSNSGSERWNSEYKPAVDFIKKIREKNKYIVLDLVGGEPTMWPDLQPFMKEVAHENTIIELITNGSRTLRYWEEFLPGNNIIVFSWHSKEVDTDHMVKVLNIVSSKGHASVNVLITPDNWDAGIDAIKKFEKIKNITIYVKPTRLSLISSELYPYTKAQLEYIHEYSHDTSTVNFPEWLKFYAHIIKIDGNNANWGKISANRENIFTGWKCNAGIDRFVIIPNGDIYRCWSNVGGVIGNIYTGYSLPDRPVICTNNNPCYCKTDAIIEKWSPEYKRTSITIIK